MSAPQGKDELATLFDGPAGARLPASRGVSAGQACVQRVDHGHGPAVTLAQAVDLVEPTLTALGRPDLVEVVAYLAAQVVGYAHSQNADASLAMAQVRSIVREYERAAGRMAVPHDDV